MASTTLAGTLPASHLESFGCEMPVLREISDWVSPDARSRTMRSRIGSMGETLCDFALSINAISHYSFVHSLAMDPRDLLRELMKAEGENPNSLAKKLKMQQSTLHRFMSGEAKEPRRSSLSPVAEHFGIPIDALFDEKIADAVFRERFRPGAATPLAKTATHQVQDAPRPHTTTDPIRQLGRNLEAVDSLTREAIEPLLQRLARDPGAAEPIAVRIGALIAASSHPGKRSAA